MDSVPRWRLAGDWFDVCSCDTPCPCEFAQAPTNNTCQGVLAWHIRDGNFGGVRLDNFNLIALGAFEGNAGPERPGPVYRRAGRRAAAASLADDFRRSNRRLARAVRRPRRGDAGSRVRPHHVRGCRRPGLLASGDARPGRGAGRGVERAEALSGPTTPPGQRVQMLNPPGSEVGPGGIATWGTATANRAEGFGFTWEWDGK